MISKASLPKNYVYLILLLFGTTSNAQVFWSEYFLDGIPATWEIVDNTNVNSEFWKATTVGPTGSYASATGPLHPSGIGEEWIIYDSDLDCSGNQDAWIITDAIDCTGKEEVWLKFRQMYLKFYDETYIRVTTDLSIPYSEWGEIEVNLIGNNGIVTDNSIEVNLTEFAAQESTVYIGFEFRNLLGQAPVGSGLDGCAYSWQIDNIELTDINPTPTFDMTISNEFYAIAPYAMWPLSQVESFGFMADVANIGQSEQTNVELNVLISDNGNGDVVYDQTMSDEFGTMVSGDTIENQLFPDAGFTPTEVTTYAGTYTINSDSTDLVPGNNVRNFNFIVSDTIFAKETGQTSILSPHESEWGPGEAYSWAYGNHFYVPNGNGWFANKVTFGIGNSGDFGVAGKTLTVYLYEWQNVVIGQQSNTTILPEDRITVGFNQYEITGNEASTDLITIDLLKNDATNSIGVTLKDDTHYILMLAYAATDQTQVAFTGNNTRDYGAQILRSEELGQARYAGILNIGTLDDNTGVLSTIGFGRDIVPLVRMHITDEPVGIDPVLAPGNIVDVFPSPAQDFVNVKLEMLNKQAEVNLQLMDVSGKVVQERQLQNVKTEQLQFKLSGLPVGSYFLNIATTAGQRSVPFVIQR